MSGKPVECWFKETGVCRCHRGVRLSLWILVSASQRRIHLSTSIGIASSSPLFSELHHALSFRYLRLTDRRWRQWDYKASRKDIYSTCDGALSPFNLPHGGWEAEQVRPAWVFANTDLWRSSQLPSILLTVIPGARRNKQWCWTTKIAP